LNPGYLKYAKVGWNFFRKKTELPAGRILGVTIEPTNICNLSCIYCPQSDSENHFINGKGFMSFDTYREVLDNILSDFNPRFVSLHRDGEPLLHKELERFVAYTVGKGIRTGTSSNCTLLPPERADTLLEAGLSFIKTDFCADRGLYEQLRTGAEWDTAYEGMRAILSKAHERGVDFRLDITDLSTHGLPDNIAGANIETLGSMFGEFGDRVEVMPVHFHNALGESIGCPVCDCEGEDHHDYFLCHHPWVHIVVDFMGRVVPCCRDLRSEYICGSLLEHSMTEIWNNERFTGIRRALVRKRPEDIELCSKCDLPHHGSYAGGSFATKVRNLFFSKICER